ncbi:MAG: penicillin-binding protein activator, partial [Anaerolineae bacterium]|nr:penicillin-binding protein activator [Anaerolineae bacterium]
MRYRKNHRPLLRLRGIVTGGLALCLAGLMAAQCRSNLPPPPSTPSLPATPSGPVLQIGLLSPESGELNTFGRVMRNGVGLAFDEWNANKSASDYRVVWQNYDTGCTFEAAQQAVEQAVADGLKFLIGPLCSEAAIG